jgi:hypothetical protein
MPTAALVTGATGFIGGRLAGALSRTGARVRCLVRDGSRARHLEREGYELREADVTDSHSLEGVGNEIDVAYYLIHAMAGGPGFDERERQGAVNFGWSACTGRSSRRWASRGPPGRADFPAGESSRLPARPVPVVLTPGSRMPSRPGDVCGSFAARSLNPLVGVMVGALAPGSCSVE